MEPPSVFDDLMEMVVIMIVVGVFAVVMYSIKN